MNGPRAAPILLTPRLVLRAHRLDDLAESAAMWADPAVVQHITGAPSTPAESWSRVLRYAGLWALMPYGYWVVEARDDGRFIGEVGLADFKRDMDPPLGCPEAGWVLTRSEHGHSFATEAMARVLRWADDTLDDDTTACIIAPDHDASINVARKLGYVEQARASHLDTPTLVMGRTRSLAGPAVSRRG